MHPDPLLQLKSPKRKRGEDESSTLPRPVLETNVDRYRRRMSDSEPNDGDVSPRSAMSGRFRQMDLRGSPSKIRRRSTHDEMERTPSPVNESCQGLTSVKAEGENQSGPVQNSDPETPESHPLTTPRKRARQSPGPSDSIDNDELLQNWWQPEEISGFTADDPDEDAYGVNGVGYQKTAAQQWKIDQKKKQQVAEWRNREAKEARAARAGGRRALRRAVTPSARSRSGSPSNAWSPPVTKPSASQGTEAPDTPKSIRKVHFTVEGE